MSPIHWRLNLLGLFQCKLKTTQRRYNLKGWLQKYTRDRIRRNEETTQHLYCETVIRICPSVSGDVQHGPQSSTELSLVVFALQHLLSPSMDSGDDPLHAQGTQAISTVALLVSFMTTRSVRALEDHVAWSSRTSLVTLMSGSRVSSS